MNKEEKEAINELKKVRWNSLAVVAKNEDGKMDISYFTEKHKKTLLNLIQKQSKIIDKATEILQEAKLAYFTKEDGGELIGQYRCFNKDDWKKYLKKEVEKDE